MESEQPLIPGATQDVELVHLFDKFRAVRAFAFDVDGVFTDNNLLVTESGELLRTMFVRDGQAVKFALAAGYPITIITAGRSEGVRRRFHELGIPDLYTNVADKSAALSAYAQRLQLQPLDICYMGDDLPDLPILRKVGLSSAPADAVPEVLGMVDYVSPLPGGKGCVRDVLEKVMKLQGKWPG